MGRQGNLCLLRLSLEEGIAKKIPPGKEALLIIYQGVFKLLDKICAIHVPPIKDSK